MTQMYKTSAQRLQHQLEPLPKNQTALGSPENPLKQASAEFEQALRTDPVTAQKYAEAQRHLYLQSLQEDTVNSLKRNHTQHHMGVAAAYGLIDLYA